MAGKLGDVVNFDTGDGAKKGVIVGHDGDKELVVPVEHLAVVGYREPEDRDAGGAGGTWWKA